MQIVCKRRNIPVLTTDDANNIASESCLGK